jgi:endoglycosylceramidase
MGEYGIYTMIDAHQDVMARIACGEGIPDFYAREAIKGVKCHGDWSDKAFKNVKKIFGECRSIESYGYERDENDWPKIKECNKQAFWKYYTTSEAMAIFDALYTNKNGLTDDFVAFWDRVAQKYAKNPYVVGFDPINEPFPADFESDHSLLNPGVFDKKKLTPLYEKVFQKYKNANPNTIMYFETAQFPDSYTGNVFPTGFESPPGGQNGSANHVLNDHSYCC